jgi:hypothetical protein
VWTPALRGGARIAVAAAQWCDAFGVVTRWRVRLELRDGEPGPVLGRDAGSWLRGTGIRALRNPGRRAATVASSPAGMRPGATRTGVLTSPVYFVPHRYRDLY